MKLRLTIEAEFEIEDFDDLEDLKNEIDNAIDNLNCSGSATGELRLDVDSLKTRDREVKIATWE